MGGEQWESHRAVPRGQQGKWVLTLTFALTYLLSLGHGGPIPEAGITSPVGPVNDSTITREKPLIMKRSAEEDGGETEEELQQRENENPYPMIISKKSAEALNKLVAALQNSLGPNVVRTSDFLNDKQLIPIRNSPNYELLNLQRRNQKDRKNYLRCYFNAVSCF